ncbi:hypothetical protein ACTNDY_02895 [Tissierellaceae bacterium HCP3S3_D8]
MEIYLIFFLFLVFIIWYFWRTSLNIIINKHVDISLVEQMDISIFSSNFSRRLYEINERTTIDNIITTISNIKARRTIQPILAYKLRYRPCNTYHIMLLSEHNVVNIDVIGKDYLTIRGQAYKIADDLNLEKIYDIIKVDVYS